MAPKGNANSIRHGAVSYMTVGKLPPGCTYIRRQLSALRTEIEKTVRERRGSITVADASHISVALRSEARALLLQRWLRIETKLSVGERIELLREIAAATAARCKAFERLRIDVADNDRHSDPRDLIDVDGPFEPPHDQTPQDAS